MCALEAALGVHEITGRSSAASLGVHEITGRSSAASHRSNFGGSSAVSHRSNFGAAQHMQHRTCSIAAAQQCLMLGYLVCISVLARALQNCGWCTYACWSVASASPGLYKAGPRRPEWPKGTPEQAASRLRAQSDKTGAAGGGLTARKQQGRQQAGR
jgi:hypothetical protein